MRAKCPLCEKPGTVVSVEMGDTWRDTLGKPPHSTFSKYPMIHAGPSPNGGLALFCHTEHDLQ